MFEELGMFIEVPSTALFVLSVICLPESLASNSHVPNLYKAFAPDIGDTRFQVICPAVSSIGRVLCKNKAYTHLL
jgi:hypothetical protein